MTITLILTALGAGSIGAAATVIAARYSNRAAAWIVGAQRAGGHGDAE